MKKLIPLVLVLVACAGTPTDKNGNPIVADASSSSETDSMFAPGEAPPGSATASEGSATVAEQDTLLSTPVAGEPAPTPAPAVADTGKPVIPPSDDSPVLPPTTPSATADSPNKSMYEMLDEHMAQQSMQAQSEAEWEKRAAFYHEGGAYQIGLDYNPKAFPEYDFDSTAARRSFDTQGLAFNFSYFPLRSLTYGRLGIGANVGIYMTKFSFQQPQPGGGTITDTSRMRSFMAYGARLKYEFQYFLGQLIVPFASFGFDKVSVRPFAAPGLTLSKNSFDSQSYGGGLSMNLNRLEPSSASRSLVSSGVKKYYLTYTYEARSDAPSSGQSHLLGLRFEY
jgi:hypothetical protein